MTEIRNNELPEWLVYGKNKGGPIGFDEIDKIILSQTIDKPQRSATRIITKNGGKALGVTTLALTLAATGTAINQQNYANLLDADHTLTVTPDDTPAPTETFARVQIITLAPQTDTPQDTTVPTDVLTETPTFDDNAKSTDAQNTTVAVMVETDVAGSQTPVDTATSTDVPTNTPLLATDTPTFTPSATPDQNADNKNQWDGQKNMDNVTTVDGFKNWYTNDSNENIRTGEDRAYDRIRKLGSKGTALSIYGKPNGELPKADELVSNATDIGRLAMKAAGFEDSKINDDDAEKLGLKLLKNNLRFSPDNQTVFTRVSFVNDKSSGIPRNKQPETNECAVYEAGVKRGNEKQSPDGKTMLLSNEAIIAITLTVVDTSFNDTDNISEIPITKQDGKKAFLAFVITDTTSAPNKDATKIDQPDGLTKQNDFLARGWAAKLDQPCGIEQAAKLAATTLPPTSVGGSGSGGGPKPDNTPNKPNTGIPPTETPNIIFTVTPARTQPVQAKRTPGGSGATPIVNTPENTPAPVNTSAPKNTVPPVLPISSLG